MESTFLFLQVLNPSLRLLPSTCLSLLCSCGTWEREMTASWTDGWFPRALGSGDSLLECFGMGSTSKTAYIQHAKHSQGGRNDQEKGTRSLRRRIRNCLRIKASGWQMVALITWKEGETKGVRLQNSNMSLKLQGHRGQLSFRQMWRESAFSPRSSRDSNAF